MKEVRCINCGRLLLKATKQYEACKEAADLEVMCHRCKSINKYKVK